MLPSPTPTTSICSPATSTRPGRGRTPASAAMPVPTPSSETRTSSSAAVPAPRRVPSSVSAKGSPSCGTCGASSPSVAPRALAARAAARTVRDPAAGGRGPGVRAEPPPVVGAGAADRPGVVDEARTAAAAGAAGGPGAAEGSGIGWFVVMPRASSDRHRSTSPARGTPLPRSGGDELAGEHGAGAGEVHGTAGELLEAELEPGGRDEGRRAESSRPCHLLRGGPPAPLVLGQTRLDVRAGRAQAAGERLGPGDRQ